MPTTPPQKKLGYVTLARNMPMPTPRFLVRLRYATESAQVLPTLRYVNNPSDLEHAYNVSFSTIHLLTNAVSAHECSYISFQSILESCCAMRTPGLLSVSQTNHAREESSPFWLIMQ